MCLKKIDKRNFACYMNNLLEYTIRIADNSLILGHRLSEWCGHGPVLEQDIAMTNIALDLVGQARSLYQLAADIHNTEKLNIYHFNKKKKITEDDLAYLRDVFDFKNILLVEQPNQDFAHTIARQFFFSAFQYPFYKELLRVLGDSKPKTQNSKHLEILRGITEKAIKEVAYHLRWSSEWVIRLGDGTDESHQRMQLAINNLWAYSGEAFISDGVEMSLNKEGIGVDLEKIKLEFDQTIQAVLSEATVRIPTNAFMHKGGKQGQHTEYLGYILADMQFMQRAYPNMVW
jgi:ring-1,2-phenylacetyl-CoA epoxidase subunit PaaC